MKNNYLFFTVFFVQILAFSQVGINTYTPKASLDVVGQPTDVNVPDGVIVPRITRLDLISKTVYSSDQVGALIYVIDLSGVNNTTTENVTTTGYYFYDGLKWQKLSRQNIADNEYGDLKQGFQTLDHNGWVLLNGRPVSSLSASQQANAASIGFTVNLPNANNSVLVQNGNTLGNVTGSNQKTIIQSDLPDVVLSGNTSSSGAHNHTGTTSSYTHSHTVYGKNSGVGTSGIVTNSNSSTTTNNNTTSSDTHNHTFTTSTAPNHNHTFTTSSINGGVTQTLFDVTPQSLSVNVFIFLGI